MPAFFDTPDSPNWIEETQSINGGFVDSTELHLLRPDQAGRLLNIDPTIAGRVQKRLGPESIGSPGPTNPNGLFPFESDLHNLHLLVGQWGSKLYSTTGDDSWSPRATTVSLVDTVYMASQGRGNGLPSLFLTSCVADTSNVSLPWGNMVCIDSGFGVTETATRCRATAWFQDRLWGLNFCASNISGKLGADLLGWSAPLDGRDFSNGQTVGIDSSAGDAGVAILPMRDGTPRMMIFKENSVHQLDIFWATDGYFPLTANALDFTKSLLRPITYQAGAVATRAVIWAPSQNSDVLFLSRDGIRALPRGLTDAQAPLGLPLSFPIQQTIDRINWAQAHRATAIYWGNVAYFAVPVDGSDRNNFVIAYDSARGGSWYELDFQVAAWSTVKFNNERNLFFQSSTSVTESGLGALGSGVTLGYHVYQTDVGNNDPAGLPIQFDYQTRAYTFDQGQQPGAGLRHRKKWNYLDLAVQAAATAATLTISYKVDDDDSWSTLRYLYVDPQDAYPFLPVQLPFSFSQGRVIHRDLLLRDIRPGFKIQFRIQDESSFARLRIVSLTLYANPLNPKFRA
jgi:hypothetical protein